MTIQLYFYILIRGVVADVFQLLADPTRRRLVELTASRERTVSELVEAVDVTQPAVSKQLATLREGGLVTVRRDGRHRLYECELEELKVMRDWLLEHAPAWNDRLDALGDHLEEM